MRQARDISKTLHVDVRSVDRAIGDLIRHRMGLRNSAKSTTSEWVRITGVLRDILKHHSGPLPPRAVVQIWSNILFASDDRTLHVFTGENAQGFWDLARIHFGAVMPITSHTAPAAVVHACAADARAIGVLPVPESEEDGQGWWEQLAPQSSPGPRIVQSLPFVHEDGGSASLPRGFAIASVGQKATGGDTTFLRFECHGELSRTRLQSLLRQSGFDAQIVSASRAVSTSAASRVLVAVRGHVTVDDERLSGIAALASDVIGSVAQVGAFADPLDTARLSDA